MPSPADEQRATLLAAIAADPDDDRALEVYADWLAQRGEPLGELIHAQLALAAAGAPAAELVAYAQRILREHEQVLAGGHHHADLRWRYRRGILVAFGHRGFFHAPPPTERASALWLQFSPDGQAKVVWMPENTPPSRIVGQPGGKGTYELAELAADTMRITATLHFPNLGEVDYDCRLAGGRLEAHIASHINGWVHDTTFELAHLDAVDTRDALD